MIVDARAATALVPSTIGKRKLIPARRFGVESDDDPAARDEVASDGAPHDA
jgi:hypothetical protein